MNLVILCVQGLNTNYLYRVAQPLFLGKLISYFTNSGSMSKDDAYFYAGGVIMCSGLAIVTLHPYMLGIMHIGMQMRVAACSLIYRKVNSFNEKLCL
jgi:ATP-binding cassette, subfamily C (CFTR/MRP), member 4